MHKVQVVLPISLLRGNGHKTHSARPWLLEYLPFGQGVQTPLALVE